MSLRLGLLTLFAVAVFGCAGEPPTFPTTPPPSKTLYSLGNEKKPEPPPAPKGVAKFEMDAETHGRVTTAIIASISIFFAALLICLLTRTLHRFAAAGIASAYIVPVTAMAIVARHFTRVLSGLADAPFLFADFALSMWNAHQVVLAGLYCGSVLLIALTVIVALTKHDGENGGIVSASLLLLAIAGTLVSVVSFVSMNRMLLAMFDPDWTAPLRRAFPNVGLGSAAQAISNRLMLTIAAAAVSILLLVLAFILSFILRPIRRRLAVVLFALIFMLAATALERSWSEVLEATARTGRVPDTVLTR